MRSEVGGGAGCGLSEEKKQGSQKGELEEKKENELTLTLLTDIIVTTILDEPAKLKDYNRIKLYLMKGATFLSIILLQ